jgi:hypothetical protein
MCLKPLLNGAFSNSYFKKPLLNGSAAFLGLTFALSFVFLLPLITFAPTDCPSHRSLILIQRSKNKNLKTEIKNIYPRRIDLENMDYIHMHIIIFLISTCAKCNQKLP